MLFAFKSIMSSHGVLSKSWMRWNTTEQDLSHDFLNSNILAKGIGIEEADPQILRDFITRSDQLARDKRLYYLTSNYFHKKLEILDHRKEQMELAYKSPQTMKLFMNDSECSPKLTTMDVNILHNSPTKSDILFFNQPVRRSCESLWSRKPRFFDSISHSHLLNSNISSNLHSVTNDSIKREGLAEYDSLELRVVSFDDIV